MRLDREFGFPQLDELGAEWGYTGHIARKSVDQSIKKRKKSGL